MSNLKSALFGAVVLLSAAAPAIGKPIIVEGSPLPTATVSYADLDLGSSAGRARLDRRVRTVAKWLCVDPNVRGLRDHLDQKTCFNFAVASARPQIEQAIAFVDRSPLPGRKAITVAAR